MAIFHCEVQIISRNQARSSVAAAAYRAGENLVSEYDGIEHNYTKKNWVEYTRIMLPNHAPNDYRDRGTLWNAVEAAEKSKDAQLAREFELALPKELSRSEQIELVEQFANEELVSKGLAVDIAIHNPPKRNDRNQPIDMNGIPTKDISKMEFINPHAHIMTPLRPIDKDGKWVSKSQTEYVCIKDGIEQGFTAEEFKAAKEEGWAKQYRYYDGEEKIWLTSEEGKERGLERVNRSPKTTPYGRMNETFEYWTNRNRVTEWRKSWETIVNSKFESMASDIRIDCRSFKDQGRVDEIPTLHMGPSATNLERRAERELREGKSAAYIVHSDIALINQEIKEHNRLVRSFKAKVDEIIESAKDFVSEISKKLEGIRAKIIGNRYEEETLSSKIKKANKAMQPEEERISKYEIELLKVDESNAQAGDDIKRLERELDNCTPFQISRKKELLKQIEDLREQINVRKKYLHGLAVMCGFSSKQEYHQLKAAQEEKRKGLKKLMLAIEKIQKDNQHLAEAYGIEIEKISMDSAEEIRSCRDITRKDLEGAVKNQLQEKYGNQFIMKRYENVRDVTDKELIDIESSQGIETYITAEAEMKKLNSENQEFSKKKKRHRR